MGRIQADHGDAEAHREEPGRDRAVSNERVKIDLFAGRCDAGDNEIGLGRRAT